MLSINESCFIKKSINAKNNCAFNKGLVTSRNVGSLILFFFFDYEGLPTREIFLYTFKLALVRSQTKFCILTVKSVGKFHKFFPPKSLVYYWLIYLPPLKSLDLFPAKRLDSKSARKKHDHFYPPKYLKYFPLKSKSATSTIILLAKRFSRTQN